MMLGSASHKPLYAQKMVGWYDPPQLLRTGALVLVSQQFALHADIREIEALHEEIGNPHDYSADGKEDHDLWIDFVADTGDGFNSTYAVANELAKDTIKITPVENSGLTEIKRGSILIFGGDLVYPTPSNQGYDDRLIHPYEDAFGKKEDKRENDNKEKESEEREVRHPDVWAVPGNHDWYDSLAAFRRLFCTEQDFGPWTSHQKRSYFAVKLPHDWWLFGIDLQLLHEIDQQQLGYFRYIIRKVMKDGERIILCSPEPYWIDRAPKAVGSSKVVQSLFDNLLKEMGGKLRLVISGDLHHYQRLSSDDDKRHYITCGTGGAFLHPTHVFNLKPRDDGFSLRASYPKADHSRRLTWLNLLVLFKNRMFGAVLSGFYFFVAIYLQAAVGEKLGQLSNEGEFWHFVRLGFRSLISFPLVLAFLLVALIAVRFTVTKSRWFGWIGGFFHAFSHFFVACFLFLAASYFCNHVLRIQVSTLQYELVLYALVVASAWIVGSILIGLYLAISLNVFHEHTTEAFSSLRISDWKGFLRMHLCEKGELELYFVGIRRVPRKWREVGPNAVPRWVSDDASAKAAQLEDYVKIRV